MSNSAPVAYASNASAARRPRLWPGVVIIALIWLVIKLPEWFAHNTMYQFMAMMLGPLAGTLALLIWWTFFSRLPWLTRWTGLAALMGGAVVAFTLASRSMGMSLVVVGVPIAETVFVLWTLVGVRLGQSSLRTGLVAVMLALWGFTLLLRSEGLNGEIHASYSWRWSPTSEERYLAAVKNKATVASATTQSTIALSQGDWPSFRGELRDGRLLNVKISTDWAQHPPQKVWDHLMGPGWSSLCVVGDRIFTQEQRGKVEAIVCLQAGTGNEFWSHEDPARFEEPIAGPGPRATPTFADGKLYTLGATGILNCLDPLTGSVIWTRNIAADTGAVLPPWGFSASPLVANGMVAVITGAKDKSVAAYDAMTGAPTWTSADGWSYASLQISKIAGKDQILFVSQHGLDGLDPLSGAVLWHHTFEIGSANRCIQPLQINDNDVLLGVAFGYGTRRLHVSQDGSSWKANEVWTSRSLKPYYNDMVLHKGNVYGFDGSTLCCINLETGKPRWRAKSLPGYGNGQILLLADQDLLLVMTEQGEAALVEASPQAHHELARFQAVHGKSWSHPVIAHGKLLIRSAEEIACYQVDSELPKQ